MDSDAILPAETISTDANLIVPDATLYHFGILASTMHIAWVRAVCGRLKSDYRYSAGIVYNNFPWPHRSGGAGIETAAQAILDTRARFPMPHWPISTIRSPCRWNC